EEPRLSSDEARIFDRIWGAFSRKIEQAGDANDGKVVLAESGQYPELFSPFGEGSIYSHIQQEKMPIWHLLEDMLEWRGFKAYLVTTDRQKPILWACPERPGEGLARRLGSG